MSIELIDVINFRGMDDCKIHLASWNGKEHPLDVFTESRDEWANWNRWRSERDDFNRTYVFSLIEFYPEPNTWLFGGLFQIVSRKDVRKDYGYEIKLSQECSNFIGRLKVSFCRPGRQKSLVFNNYCEHITVSELLKESYNGETFCGYESINHEFGRLESIFKHSRAEWKAALENIKGVYLVTDKSNGKKYVGAAYGESGIWSRWSCYLGTGHGHNDELTRLIKMEGLEYARKNFRLSLLEYHPMRTDDRVILNRESYWKNVLLSRLPFGYNGN